MGYYKCSNSENMGGLMVKPEKDRSHIERASQQGAREDLIHVSSDDEGSDYDLRDAQEVGRKQLDHE
jgi:hypothetical protein